MLKTIVCVFISILVAMPMSGCVRLNGQTTVDSVCFVRNFTTEIPENMLPVLEEGKFINFEVVSEDCNHTYEIGYVIIVDGIATNRVLFSDIWNPSFEAKGYSLLMTGAFFENDVTLHYGSYYSFSTTSSNSFNAGNTISPDGNAFNPSTLSFIAGMAN